jgi:hypothetical protein
VVPGDKSVESLDSCMHDIVLVEISQAFRSVLGLGRYDTSNKVRAQRSHAHQFGAICSGMTGDKINERSIIHPRRYEVDVAPRVINKTQTRQYVGMLKFLPHLSLCEVGVLRLREKRPSQSRNEWRCERQDPGVMD